MQGTKLGGEERTEYKTIYDNTCTFLVFSFSTMGIKTPKDIISYTHYFYF